MYLFTRSRTVHPGKFAKAMETVVETTEQARTITGQQIDAWSAVMSPEIGTIVWTLFAENIAQIEQAGDALTADEKFMKLIERDDDRFEGPYVDGLATLVHGNIEGAANTEQYVGVATATPANGQLQAAMAAGIEIADHVTKVTGDNCYFFVNNTGIFGGVTWVTPAADAAAVDAAEAALMADADWLPLLDRVGPAFTAGGAQSLYRRIA